MNEKKSIILRVLVGSLAPLSLLSIGAFIYFFKSPVPCLFYKYFNIYCVGCGSGRAAYDLLHLRFVEAFLHNPLFIIVLPFVMYYLIISYLKFVFNIIRIPVFKINKTGTIIIFVLMIAYWVLRNIPTMVKKF